MVASARGCGLAVSAVLVSVAEVAAKKDKGFVGVGFSAPFAAGDIKYAGGVDDDVSDADNGGGTWCIVAGGCDMDADVELSEEGLDWSVWMPRGLHVELIGVKLVLGDFAMVGPKMCEE
jgi:hypothetical protein